jgi:hypothetical protein
MATFKEILSNFYFEPVNGGNKFPKFGKAGRQDYQFTCKRCGSISEPMDFHRNITFRLASHLTRHCRPSTRSESEQEQEAINSD